MGISAEYSTNYEEKGSCKSAPLVRLELENQGREILGDVIVPSVEPFGPNSRRFFPASMVLVADQFHWVGTMTPSGKERSR